MAVRNGLIDVMRSLINAGANVYEKTHRNDNLLHIAAKLGRADIIGLLLDKGLNVHDKN